MYIGMRLVECCTELTTYRIMLRIAGSINLWPTNIHNVCTYVGSSKAYV